MKRARHKALIALFFISLHLFCVNLPPSRSRGSGMRFFFGPSYGFYSINKNHATHAVPKMSAIVGFRKEVHIDREFRTFFLFGIDYFFHGLNFRSYYFKPDSVQLYDKTFPYDYSLFMQEINVPLQVKYSFTRENNSLFSPYIMAGYHLRYLLPGKLNVSQNGNRTIAENADLKFKNPFLYEKINSFVSLTVGWQKNSINNSKSSFFVEANFRYGFSPFYFTKTYAPSSLYTSSSHLALLIGMKF